MCLGLLLYSLVQFRQADKICGLLRAIVSKMGFQCTSARKPYSTERASIDKSCNVDEFTDENPQLNTTSIKTPLH